MASTQITVSKTPTSGRKWVSTLAWVALLALVAGGSFVYVRAMIMARNRPLPLVVDGRSLELGEMWSQKAFEVTLPVTNNGRSEISILDLQPSCKCTKIEPRQFVLGQGETASIQLTIDLTTRRQAEGSVVESPFELTIGAHTKSDYLVQPAPWTLRGRVKTALFATPRELDFSGATAVVTGFSAAPQSFTATANYRLKEVRAEIIPPIATVAVSPESADWKTCQVVVTPVSELPLGPFAAQVRLLAELPSGEVLPPLVVPLSGVVVRDTSATPDSIQFGAVTQGTLLSQTVVIASRHMRPFRVEPAKDQSPGLIVAPAGDDMGDEVAYYLEVEATTIGRQSVTARFHVFPDNEPRFDIDVSIHYECRTKEPAGQTIPVASDEQ